MSRRKTSIGIAVLFALALSAFSATSASAAGETAFTCVKDAGGALFGPHCLSASTGDATKYKHIEIAQDTTTTGTTTNANSASGTTASSVGILKGTAAGVSTTIECTTVSGEGTFENRKTGEEMFSDVEGQLSLSGCAVTAPAGKGCKVANGGTILTNLLTGRTIGGGKVRIEPKTGTTFTELKIEGCSVSGLNNTFPIGGVVEAKTNGATISATHAEVTAQVARLIFAGQKAGIEGSLTHKGHSKAGEETVPLTITATP